jgi:hypothetical protein
MKHCRQSRNSSCIAIVALQMESNHIKSNQIKSIFFRTVICFQFAYSFTKSEVAPLAVEISTRRICEIFEFINMNVSLPFNQIFNTHVVHSAAKSTMSFRFANALRTFSSKRKRKKKKENFFFFFFFFFLLAKATFKNNRVGELPLATTLLAAIRSMIATSERELKSPSSQIVSSAKDADSNKLGRVALRAHEVASQCDEKSAKQKKNLFYF